MPNIFAIPQNDQSIYYLGQIFGYVGNLLPVDKASMILGVMFKGFNAMVLTVATLIVLYVTVVGVIKTAAEGEFLGRNWSSIWIPLRMVIGIAALVPTPSGYSTIQILMMWVVMQGIGAADTVWTSVLQYTQLMGSATATVSIPTVGQGTQMQNLFQALICQAGEKASYKYTSPGKSTGGYYCALGDASYCTRSDADMLNINGFQSSVPNNKDYRQYKMGPPYNDTGACGAMNFCDDKVACAPVSSSQSKVILESKIRCEACRAQIESLQSIVLTFGQMGKAFTDADYAYRRFYDKGDPPPQWVQNYCNANNLAGPEKCCAKPSSGAAQIFAQLQVSQCGIGPDLGSGTDTDANPTTLNKIYWPYFIKPSLVGDVDFIKASADMLTNNINNAVMQAIQDAVADTKITDSTLLEAQQVGWIFAGAYYYAISAQNNKNIDAAMPKLEVNAYTPTSGPMSTYRNNFSAAEEIINQASTASQNTLVSGMPPQLKGLSKLASGMDGGARSIMNAFMDCISGGKSGETAVNPLVKLQSLGKILLIIAQLLFALIIVVVVGISIWGYLNIYYLGTGADNPAGPTITTLMIFFTPMVTLLMGALFSFGALLAVYTPLIPYVVFTMGAISWFIMVIEAMVAAPIVALGILMPSGHDVFGRAEQALMQAFGIFLRPTLMIFGLIAAMLLCIVVVTMINAGFKGVMAQVYTNPGLVEIIIFLGAYVGLLLAAINKSFALIHIVPDNVLSWIGGQTRGEAGAAAGEGLQAAKGGAMKGAEGARGYGQGMMSKGKEAAGAWDKAAEAKRNKDKGDEIDIKGGGGGGKK